MDQAQKKEALSRSKKELTPEMRVKIKVMAKRSKAAGSSHCPDLDVPSMARAIRSKAVAADERLTKPNLLHFLPFFFTFCKNERVF